MVSLTSCSNDDNNGSIVNTNPNEVLLKKTMTKSYSSSSTDDVNGYMTTLWFYNGKKLNYTLSSRGGVRTNYFYTGDLITRVDENNGGSIVSSTYEYDESDRLIAVLVNGNPSANYTYNPDGTVTMTGYSGIYESNVTETIYFTAGEINKIVTSYETNPFSTTYEFAYDDKYSPTKNIVGFDKIHLNQAYGSYKNVTAREYLDSDGIDGHVNKTFTYNALGFPTAVHSSDDHVIDSYDKLFFYE